MYLASFLTLILLILILGAALLFLYPVKVAASFNSEQQPDIHVMISWLSPFLKVYVAGHNGRTVMTVKLFGRKVLIRNLASKKGTDFKSKKKKYIDYINMARFLRIRRAKIFASYGFEDPSITGMVCGAIDFVSYYINPEELYNNADFFAITSYFNISASAEINAGVSFVRILFNNPRYRNAHALQGNR